MKVLKKNRFNKFYFEKKVLLCAVLAVFAGGVFYSQNENVNDGVLAESLEKTESSENSEKKSASEDSEKLKKEKAEDSKEKKEESKKSKKAKKTEKTDESDKKQEKNKEITKIDPYLGDVYIPVKKYSLFFENYSIVCHSERGTFNFYSAQKNRKKTPVFSNYEDSISSSFFLKIGKTVYCLNKDSAVQKELWKTANGARLVYTINNKARVAIDFSFEPEETVKKIFALEQNDEKIVTEQDGNLLKTEEDEEVSDDVVLPGVIKIRAYVTNLSEKKANFALKSVLDTAVGEGADFHFLTENGLSFNSEHQFENMLKERALCVSDSKTSAEFVFEGKNISSPEVVTIANIAYLNSPRWIMVSESGRSFNSLNAYNNSGISVVWPQKKLQKEETYSIQFFAGISSNGRKCDTLKYVDFVETDSTKKVEKTEPAASFDVQGSKKADVDFIVQNVTEKQLDFEYIQNLINRIDALESTDTDVDRNELRQLNSELDAILAALRKRN